MNRTRRAKWQNTMTKRSVHETNQFKRDFKRLSHEAQQQCRDVIDMLAASEDPRSIAYERLSTREFVYRFGNYRLLYTILPNGSIEIIRLLGVGHGHSAYR